MPPVNDNFANAVVLTGTSGTVGPYTIDDATTEGGEPQPVGYGFYHTVWFTFSGRDAGAYTFSTYGSPAGDAPSGDGEAVGSFGNLDTEIALFRQDGSGFGGLSLLATNDDAISDPSGLWSYIAGTLASADVTYYVQVGVFDPSYVGDVNLTYTIPASTTPPPPTADCPTSVFFVELGSGAGLTTPVTGTPGSYSDGYIDWFEPEHDVGDLLLWVYVGTKNDVSTPDGYTELVNADWDNAPTSPPIHGPNSTTNGPAWKQQATLVVAYRVATDTWSTPDDVAGTITGFAYTVDADVGTESGFVGVYLFQHLTLDDGHAVPWFSPAVLGGGLTNTDYQVDLGVGGGAFGGFYPAYDPHPATVTATDTETAMHPGNHIFGTIRAFHGPLVAEDLGGGANSLSLDPPEFDVGGVGDPITPTNNQLGFRLFLSSENYFVPDDPAYHDVFTTPTPGGTLTGHAGADWQDGFIGVAGTDFYVWTLTGGLLLYDFVIQSTITDCFLAYWGINASTPT